MNTRLIAGALALALLGTAVADEKKAAADFSLQDTDGKTHKLSDLKGKVVVLEWTNKDCPFVKLHYKPGAMQKMADQYIAKGVVWLSIDSTHSAKLEALKAWKAEQKINHPILLDQDGAIGRAYGAATTPHFFIVKDGALLYQGAYDDYKQGKGSTVNYVSQALDEVLAGKAVSNTKTKPYGCSVKYSPKGKS